MNILLIDSTSAHCYVAIVNDNGIIDGSQYNCGTKHSEIMCNLVESVMHRAGVTFSTLDAIACGIGTGSFTGIRIGVSTVLGYNRASGVPMIELPSLKALHIYSGSQHVIMDCGIGYYYAQYDHCNTVVEPHMIEYNDSIVEQSYMFDKTANYLEALAGLATMQYREGNFVASLEPLYIRKSQAELNL